MKNRDKDIIEHILLYCDQIHQAVDLFGNVYKIHKYINREIL